MNNKILKSVAFLSVFLFMVSCGESSDVVESGTYQGTIEEVEPSKDEIYVKIDDNKTLELYFNDNTQLTRDGNTVEFSELEKGQKVEVKVEKTEKGLDPISVKIME
ncbi:hypothetical protein APR41_03010 [Salegentibacter salinarum]|uniref:DUF5666 domain-containing protein n=1 Tax=Salegentibacter salinarum TaxID=447422 RepID=A0A2N0TXY6_9FLAO|nr:hypothetical protein [Salegentibacter salinarum]PKD19591.1 hypothetical protein APR41_03010 [Salegentibacter salinarum]SKB42178.1 hypothetical protein SAMN05660903_00615 [Salegentibacter salinarum]